MRRVALGCTKTTIAKKTISETQDSEKTLQSVALQTLKKNYPKFTREKLVELLETRELDEDSKLLLLFDLEEIGTEKEEKLIVSLLKEYPFDEKNISILEFAFSYFKKTKSEKILDVLLKFMIANTGNFGYKIAHLMGEIGTKKIRDTLWEIITNKDYQDFAKYRAAEALGIASRHEKENNLTETKLQKIGSKFDKNFVSAYRKGRQYQGEDFVISLFSEINTYEQYLEKCSSHIQEIERRKEWLNKFTKSETLYIIEKLKDNDLEKRRDLINILKIRKISEYYSKIEEILQQVIKKNTANQNVCERAMQREYQVDLAKILFRHNPKKTEKRLFETFNKANSSEEKINILECLAHIGSHEAGKQIINICKENSNNNKRYLISLLSTIHNLESAKLILDTSKTEEVMELNSAQYYLRLTIDNFTDEHLYKLVKYAYSEYKKEKRKDAKKRIYSTIQHIKNETGKRYIKILGEEFA